MIDGDSIQNRLPEIDSFGEQRLRPTAEQMAGRPLKLLDSPRLCMRVQRYTQKCHGFRRHLDGHSCVALLAVKNSNLGQIRMIFPRLTLFLRFILYPVYALPEVFSIFLYQRVIREAGDRLFMPRGRLLHRGITLSEGGERALIFPNYELATIKN